MSEKIIAYKAMDKNMQCRGKQYEMGKTYTEDKADCCTTGMHACKDPFDVLHYYNVSDSARFFEVECDGSFSQQAFPEDSKFACTELTVKSELKLTDMLKIGVEAVMKRVKEKTEDAKKNAASGDYSTGAASGDYSTAEVSGKDSIAVANGYKSKACGALGCYLVLTEYNDDGDMVCAKMERVDGTKIKENVYYTLKNGEFVEWEE